VIGVLPFWPLWRWGRPPLTVISSRVTIVYPSEVGGVVYGSEVDGVIYPTEAHRVRARSEVDGVTYRE